MAEAKPVPTPSPDSALFWEGTKRGELRIQQCQSCGALAHYPRLVCPHCGSQEKAWITASGKGTVYSYTVLHRAPSPAFAAEVPYVVAIIELDEGVRLMSNVVDCPPDEVRCGQRVKVRFDEVNEAVSLPRFVPDR